MNDLELRRNLNENWYWDLTGIHKDGFSSQYEFLLKVENIVVKVLPGTPRCAECGLPLSGLGSWLTVTRPASYSPRLCNKCEQAMRKEEAGAEVELSMLFADVRGSTSLAQTTSTSEFKEIIQRFYRVVTEVLVGHNAMVNRLMGDQVIGLFAPRLAGMQHAKVAVAAALDFMEATGHEDRQGLWIQVGIGVHSGVAYVGAVGTASGINEIAVLGSAPNLAARLSSQAADGEIIVSELAATAAELASQDAESRYLDLKGFDSTVAVRVLRVGVDQVG